MAADPVTAPTVAAATTRSPAGTRALAAVVAGLVRPGDVVVLAGDLGAGKTTFVQGFAAALGVAEPVTSPTFALVRHYPCGRTGGGPAPAGPGEPGGALAPGAVRTLLHADVYRLDRLSEVADLGLGQMVEDDAVALVEWGDVAIPVLGEDVLTVRLTPGATDEERRVTVSTVGARWADRRVALAEAVRRGGEEWDGAA